MDADSGISLTVNVSPLIALCTTVQRSAGSFAVTVVDALGITQEHIDYVGIAKRYLKGLTSGHTCHVSSSVRESVPWTRFGNALDPSASILSHGRFLPPSAQGESLVKEGRTAISA